MTRKEKVITFGCDYLYGEFVDYLIILFALVVGGVMLFVRLRDFKGMKEATDKALLANHYEKYDYSLFIKTFYCIAILIGAAAIIYGIVKADGDMIAIGIIVVLMFVGELLIVPHRLVLYYNDTNFIVTGKVTRYKSIKDFEEMKYVSFGFVRAVTLSGEKLPMSRKAYEIVKEKKDNLKKKN